MSEKSPAFQFYVKDWLSSPHVQVMTPEQEGAYIRLLCYCWDSGDCSLIDDDEELAILSRLGEGWLNGGCKLVRRCFEPHPDRPGYLTNDRLRKEMIKQAQWALKSKVGGLKSAEARAKLALEKNRLKGGSTKGQPATPPPVEPNGNSSSSSLSLSDLKSPQPPSKTKGESVKTNSPEPNPAEELAIALAEVTGLNIKSSRRKINTAVEKLVAGGCTPDRIRELFRNKSTLIPHRKNCPFLEVGDVVNNFERAKPKKTQNSDYDVSFLKNHDNIAKISDEEIVALFHRYTREKSGTHLRFVEKEIARRNLATTVQEAFSRLS